MQPGVERAVATERQAVFEIGQPDEDERQECARVPLVVQKDVQVVEGVLVQEVGLVEEEGGIELIAAEVLDV
jgi:hypothetical protein